MQYGAQQDTHNIIQHQKHLLPSNISATEKGSEDKFLELCCVYFEYFEKVYSVILFSHLLGCFPLQL